MKKRRYFAGAAAILLLLLLCGFAPQSITEDKDAQVLLYETYGESEILVYTGRTTVLYRPDGRSAEAPFNGQYAVLHGDTVTVFAETEEFLAVERFSAETLEETDLFALRRAVCALRKATARAGFMLLPTARRAHCKCLTRRVSP